MSLLESKSLLNTVGMDGVLHGVLMFNDFFIIFTSKN
jgi:hypothetical protein